MKLLKTITQLCVLATLCGTTMLAQSLNPNERYVQNISYGGSGAPQGSVASSFSNDRKSFTLIFDSFVASSGPGIPITESRKDAQLIINMAGKGKATFTHDYRGYVSLPAGVTAEVVTMINGKAKKNSRITFQGPVSKDYLLQVESKIKNSKGGAVPQNLQVAIRLVGPAAAQAQITVDSIDGKLTPRPDHDSDDESEE